MPIFFVPIKFSEHTDCVSVDRIRSNSRTLALSNQYDTDEPVGDSEASTSRLLKKECAVLFPTPLQAGHPIVSCDKMEERVSLRPVTIDDLPIFFVHQLDPEATKLAAFPSRDRDAFFTHWTTNILGNPAAVSLTILAGDQVAGNIGAWTDAASNDRLICYWLGREFWGRGIASAALSQFLRFESTRPLSAHVAKHNLGSIRVLEKAGFARAGEEAFSLPSGARLEEFIYFLVA